MIVAVHQPQYLPYLGFFHKMACSDAFVWLDDVQYKKREYQNRNRIRTPGGWIWLTVPVKQKGRYEQAIKDVEIEPGDWGRGHWESLRRNYARAPQFARHAPFFEALYAKPWTRLEAVCRETVEYLRRSFGIETPMRNSSDFGVKEASTRRLIALCKEMSADAYLSGPGGKAYLEEPLFEASGVRLLYQSFEAPAYKQCFPGFEANLSAVDFLFNVEPAEAAAWFASARRATTNIVSPEEK